MIVCTLQVLLITWRHQNHPQLFVIRQYISLPPPHGCWRKCTPRWWEEWEERSLKTRSSVRIVSPATGASSFSLSVSVPLSLCLCDLRQTGNHFKEKFLTGAGSWTLLQREETLRRVRWRGAATRRSPTTTGCTCGGATRWELTRGTWVTVLPWVTWVTWVTWDTWVTEWTELPSYLSYLRYLSYWVNWVTLVTVSPLLPEIPELLIYLRDCFTLVTLGTWVTWITLVTWVNLS